MEIFAFLQRGPGKVASFDAITCKTRKQNVIIRIGQHRIKQIDSFALVDRSSKVINSALSKTKFITKKHLDLYNSVFSLYIKVYQGGARKNSCRKVQFYHNFFDKNLTTMQRIKNRHKIQIQHT